MSLATIDRGSLANVLAILANALLMVAKFVVGWMAGSAALTADGFNSAGDVVATAAVFASFLYARKPPDEDHNYGHGNAESVAGLLVGGLLFATGLFIFIEGSMAFLEPRELAPGTLALWVAAATMLIKELLYRFTVQVGRELNSPSLLASARDHRADVLVGMTVFAGILGARSGWLWLDPLAAVLVGLYIAWMAIEPVLDNMHILMDRAPPGMSEPIIAVIEEDVDVCCCEQLRIHPIGSYFNIDADICVDGDLPLREADDIAHRVEDAIKERIDHVRTVTVHVSPRERCGCGSRD
jgi:cation diffusion facilitator family transporter